MCIRDRDEEVTTEAYFHGRCHTTLIADQDVLPDRLEASYEKIIESIDKFTREGSGWVLDRIISLELVLSRYQPLTASSFIRTPPESVSYTHLDVYKRQQMTSVRVYSFNVHTHYCPN